MLVGKQLGPFTIDKELGAGAMGAVYRGRYVKTGQAVAVKVMAPGLGDTNPHAVARFEREAAILKQLTHPNIVRYYGASKSQGTRYYAMEYVEGESLDRVMARRGRMTWEEVVTLGQQLCAALQHAHEKGIVHRDIKPSNIMVLPDGTLKLTDFGIAKDLDCTQLTSANCTVGTAAYMSPEQCRGERDITYKSDLYSTGVLFYELVTGRKPFTADNAMEMFLQHVQGTFERPSRLVLELPVWFDTLICQLLEKKPELRPLDAAMVANVLGQIQEKVEAQQSAGVDAVRSRTIDRPRGQRNPDDEDREAALTLMAATGKGKRKRKKKPFYRKLWFQASALAVGLAGVVLLLYLVFRPPAQDKLYAGVERAMQKDISNDEVRQQARERIKEYLKYYKQPGKQTDQVRAWQDELDVKDLEWKLDKHMKNQALFKPQTDTEKQTFKAVEDEDAGDLDRARSLWEEVQKQEGAHGWGLVAGRHLRDIDQVSRAENELTVMDHSTLPSGRDPKFTSPEQRLAFTGQRALSFGDPFLAEDQFKELKEKSAGNPDLHGWYLFAVKKLRDAGQKVKEVGAKQGAEKYREKRVEEALAEADKALNAERPKPEKEFRAWQERMNKAWRDCMYAVVLYDKNDKLKPLLDKARAKARAIQAKYSP